jgi:sporulation protein YlmC with PRC-barrel domain
MVSKILIGSLLATVITLPVLAQQSPATPTKARTTAMAPMAHAGQWRASKLVGLNVYSDRNEKLGDINEILLDQSGTVTGVVIGVGGFLGMGERAIMVSMNKLKFVNEPVHTSATTTTRSTTTGSAERPATTGERTTTTTTVRAKDEKWYPDHAVLSGVTKDQLKNMTEFKYN